MERQFGLQVDYVHDGPQLLGTGGAIKQALPLLDDAFFVLYGDSYLLATIRLCKRLSLTVVKWA